MHWTSEVDATDEDALWAASGADHLTGRPADPPSQGPGAPASVVAAALRAIAEHHEDADLPGVDLLSERARLANLTRNAPWSCGGAFRILPTADGWFGLSLSRSADLALVPALISQACPHERPWDAVAAWLRMVPTAEAATRISLLGLPGGPVPAPDVEPTPLRRSAVLGEPTTRHAVIDRPLVVDLSSLWAGPLCTRLLRATGARVVKVESRRRPDGARSGPPAVFERLNAGKESVVLDFDHPGDLDRLHELVAAADVVVEASRPRALRHLGIDAESQAARGAVWTSLTAYGRSGDDAMRVGFGDDVAAAAGLVVWTEDGPGPVGDAIADPLTGVVAAAATVDALSKGVGELLDVSMYDTAAWARSLRV